MDIFDIIIVFALGFVFGNLYTVWKLRSAIRELADEYGVDLELSEPELATKPSEKTSVVSILRTEKHKDILYLYDTSNDKFVCQACSLEELAKLINNMNYAKVVGVIDGESKFWFFNGSVYKDLSEVKYES